MSHWRQSRGGQNDVNAVPLAGQNKGGPPFPPKQLKPS
jgi:hypothetical protein